MIHFEQRGYVGLATIDRQERRNALLHESATVLEEAAPDDRYSYQIAKEALSGPKNGGYPDWFIDRYLPQPLRKEAPAHGPS